MNTNSLRSWMRNTGFALAALTVACMAGCSSSISGPTVTQLALTSSPATLNTASPLTLTATLSGGAPGAIGVVIFYDGTTALQPVVLSGGTATATVSNLSPGTHAITAAYGGDQTHSASTSPAVSVSVFDPTTISLTASPLIAAVGDSVTLTATVAGGNFNPTGPVTFSHGATTLGTANLATVNNAQVATLVTTALPLGTDIVTASYAASGAFLASTPTTATVQIHAALIPTTIAVITSPSGTVAAGTLTTITATLTPSSGTVAPTGTITLKDGSVTLGTVTLGSSNTVTLSTKQFVTGANSVTAVYSGDVIYAASTSPASTLTITAYTGPTYTNPLNVKDPVTGTVYNCPDPAIIKSQAGTVDTWYVYCTGDAFNKADTVTGGAFKAHLISVFSSPDLVNWTYVRDAFATLPTWVAAGQELQTPAIKFFGGLYHLYYEAPSVAAAPNGSAIGVGVSTTAAGPFTDSGGPVVDQQKACGGGCNRTVFSPEVIADQTGQLWITYGGIFAGLSIRKLASTGLTSDPATEINIGIDNYYQDPFIFFKNGFFYEFVTAGGCCNGPGSTYNVHVGRSASITGPYNDAEGNDVNAFSTLATRAAPGGDPVLVMNGNDIVGAGSNSVFTDESGQDYILYSGVSKKQPYLPSVTGYTARQLMMDALDWVNGWPVARNGAGPSDFSTPQPVPAAQPGTASGYVPPLVTPDAPGTPIAAASDEFNSTTLSTQWKFLHGNAAYTLTGTAYSIPSISQETTIPASMANLPILAEPEPAGNYLLEVKLSFNVPATGCCNFNYAQAGVLIYHSDIDFLKLDEFANFDTRQIEFVNQIIPPANSGYPTDSFAPVATPNFAGSTYLRIAKRVGAAGAPDTYTSYSSTDGINYLKGPAWTASYGTAGQIGLYSGNLAGYVAVFDYIRVTTLTP